MVIDLMTNVVQCLKGSYSVPGETTFKPNEMPPRRRFCQGSWDDLDLGSLLGVRDVHRINTDVGYLLRHYWLPATELEYHQSSLISVNGSAVEVESVIYRTLAKCQADMVIWRDRINAAMMTGEMVCPIVAASSTLGADSLHCYNRSEQSLRSRISLSRNRFEPESLENAKCKAMAMMPFLHPINPTAPKSPWEFECSKGRMRYEVVAIDRVGDTPVVIIQKEGRLFGVNACGYHANNNPSSVLHRQGLVVFAYNRSVVLEERVHDIVELPDSDPQSIEQTVITRLIRSIPKKQLE